jgi:transglutaminase superfamily protein
MAAEALALLAVFRLGLAVVPVHKIIGAMTRGSVGAFETAGELAVALRVKWAVEAAVRRSPVRFVCFPQTLAGYAMLRRRGIVSTMVYGVRRSPESKLIAHTLLMLGERAVVGGEGAGEFAEVGRWGCSCEL